MEPAPVHDLTLVSEVLEGNQLSFQLLVERYQDKLFSIVRHYTRNPVEVEDIVQEALLKVYKRLDSFQQQSSFSTWLYRVTVNTALDFLKRCGRNPVRAVEDPEVVVSEGAQPRIAAPDAGMEQEEIARITHEVLLELPEIFHKVIVMREFEGLAYQEIADILGISIGTVESRLFRARARFKEHLLRSYPEFDPTT
ncbi:MAG: RNA polymerase sigma-70 factor (ECF subfamily) [Planctomycetota bacterium]|jgi:RNA polymerase sigma-70 factor (ECF subfamily)